MDRLYGVHVICPLCGKRIWVTSGLHLQNGPTESGSVAELYGQGELPAPLASKMNDLVWCDTDQQYIEQGDRDKVYLLR